MVDAIGVKIAFITDPTGTYIELTQGLRVMFSVLRYEEAAADAAKKPDVTGRPLPRPKSAPP